MVAFHLQLLLRKFEIGVSAVPAAVQV